MAKIKKILHITAHMGGGAGKAISGILKAKNDFENKLLILEEPNDKKYYNICVSAGIDTIITSDITQIKKYSVEADVIVLNWWCHPLFVNVFSALNGINARVVLWSHISGLFYPHLSYDFINRFDKCMFTTKCTYENSHWTLKEKKEIEDNSNVIYGIGEFNPENSKHKLHYSLNDVIGYVGTLNFSKLNSEFPELCSVIINTLPSTYIYLYGKCDEPFKKSFNSNHIVFKGFCDDVEKILTEMDIFCYPLDEENFATTENSLLEAMAAGLPVVVLNNPAERTIVEHGITGLVANDIDQLKEYVCTLYYDKKLRETLGRNAREYVIETYSYKQNIKSFYSTIDNVCLDLKHALDFSDIIRESSKSFFKYFCSIDMEKIQNILDGNNDCFLSKIYFGENKSSPKHFNRYFPDEKYFIKLVDRLERMEYEDN